MTIVFFIDQFYMHGGIERVLSIKANYLANDANNTIHIVTTEQKNNKSCYEFNAAIKFSDLAINYHRNKSYFHPKNLIKLPQHIYKSKRILKKIKPDIVVVCSHSTDTYFIPFILKDIPKIKEFHYSKSIEIDKRLNPRNKIKRCFLKFADYVESKYDKLVVLNKDEQKYYKSQNTTIIPNPLTFCPKDKAKFENKIVIAAGRIAQVKGFDLLIDIWDLVATKNRNWQLHIYGDGQQDYINFLQQKIDDKNLGDVIKLQGATSNIQDKMLNSSLYAMTSHNECFPLVLLEAQACGLPIIAFDCPHGPRNIISEKNGVLIELYNKEQYAKKLTNLFSNEESLKKMGKYAKKNTKGYTVEVIMDKWKNLFNELIKIG
ncbi:MAG: glycosyltransferase family 4 protein [Algibacter sp.]|uniref:glycosyltransferase family 4 protein n=1 Tax=Algibacter sp. TaxID=1872428 RepID=UPI003298021F